MFHWLFPEKEMFYGLKMVALDTDCKQIKDCVAVGSVAEIYAEICPNSENDEHDRKPGSDVELLTGPNASGESEGATDHYVIQASCPPTENDCIAITSGNSKDPEEENSEDENENSEDENENSEEDEDKDSSESDYYPYDDIISDEDEEAVENNKKYKEYKAKMKAGQLEHLDDAMLDGGPTIGLSNKVGEENDTAYEDSSDLYDSFDEIGSDGEVKTFKSRYRRFKEKGDVPEFTLGMKFDGKEDKGKQ